LLCVKSRVTFRELKTFSRATQAFFFKGFMQNHSSFPGSPTLASQRLTAARILLPVARLTGTCDKPAQAVNRLEGTSARDLRRRDLEPMSPTTSATGT